VVKFEETEFLEEEGRHVLSIVVDQSSPRTVSAMNETGNTQYVCFPFPTKNSGTFKTVANGLFRKLFLQFP